MEKIKILFAIGRLTVGGGEKLLVYQLKHLNKEKFEPYLLTLFPEKEESFELLVRPDFTSNKVGPYYWEKMRFSRLFDIFAWFKLWRFLRKEKFDVVITSLFSANLMVRLALLFAGRPGVLISYEHNIYHNKHKWQIWMDWFLSRFTDKIIVDAESVKQFTVGQEGIPADKFLVMHIPPLSPASGAERASPCFERGGPLDAHVKVGPPAGGPTLNDLRKEFGIILDDKVILTVSRFVQEKGHKYLIEAARKVLDIYSSSEAERSREVYNNVSSRQARTINNFPIKFLIVGWGHLEQSLKDEIKKLGLENSVFLLGKRDIAEVLLLADIYVEPALSVDIGIASMEAMAQGLPIISTNVGEMPVFVKDGENGFLVPSADSNSLSEKIIFLLKNDELRKKMGEKSKDVVKNFTLEKYMENFETLVLSLLK